MSDKTNLRYQNPGRGTVEPFMAAPTEVSGETFLFKEIPVDTSAPGYRQPWNGYNPPCTLKTGNAGRELPVHTANIKVRDIYAGIEVEGDKWMRMACEAARDSVGKGGGPFASIILQVDDSSNQILRYWVNYNQVTSINDPTAHAEVMAIRSACASLGVFNLGRIRKVESKLPQPGETSRCVIYSSTEPCPMCYSAIRWANLPMLLFAATRFDAGVEGVNFSDEAIYQELSRPYSGRTVKVYQCTVDNSLDAFNLWKRSEKTPY